VELENLLDSTAETQRKLSPANQSGVACQIQPHRPRARLPSNNTARGRAQARLSHCCSIVATASRCCRVCCSVCFVSPSRLPARNSRSRAFCGSSDGASSCQPCAASHRVLTTYSLTRSEYGCLEPPVFYRYRFASSPPQSLTQAPTRPPRAPHWQNKQRPCPCRTAMETLGSPLLKTSPHYSGFRRSFAMKYTAMSLSPRRLRITSTLPQGCVSTAHQSWLPHDLPVAV
jgi:hypothetical protein